MGGLLDSSQTIDLQVTAPVDPIKLEVKFGQRVVVVALIVAATILFAKVIK